MKNILMSYADEKYTKSQKLLSSTALSIGKVDLVKNYNPNDIQNTDFYRRNAYILNQPRGCFIWKPYLILKTVETLEKGDILLYSDAGLSVIDNLDPLFKIARESSNGNPVLFIVPGGHKNKTWTKRDTFVLMGCDDEYYWEGNQCNGALSLWQNNDKCLSILKEWLRFCRDSRIITDETCISGKFNFTGFKAHRHDQSVISLLALKYKLETYRDPTQYSNEDLNKFTNSLYGQLFNHHRGKF